MTITIHELAVDSFVHMLGTLSSLLDKARDHAAARKFDVASLVTARLAPDMFPLGTQVYLSCHHARDGVARLTGQDAPVIERFEENFDQLVARIQATLEFVQGTPNSAFDGAEQRTITITVNPERIFDLTALQFLRDWSLPHFYFHVVTAYDILRESGVLLGKRDYVPYMAGYLRQPK
jgi:uncharacterized protein